MNAIGFLFLLVNAAALLALPRRWAALPLLMGACYITAAQKIEIGPFNFTLLRLLIVFGFLRIVARKERMIGGFSGMDVAILIWCIWLLFTSCFHNSFGEALVFRLGAVFTVFGLYFLVRVFIQTEEDVVQLVKITAILLIPVALEMAFEKLTAYNVFSYFGGVPAEVMIRNGWLRAQGPFAHPILAGTVGAVCAPMMIGIRRLHPGISKIGLLACLVMIVASTSSGPIMSFAIGIFALILWRWRHLTGRIRAFAVVIYILIDFASSRPAYYALLNRIDLTGSSTGWHRAELIRSAFAHSKEWMLAGTDYTRHWMPSGVSWSTDQVDITNHYLLYGVWGGFPLMAIFICILWIGFRYVGQTLQLNIKVTLTDRFLIWALGSTLFANVVTGISVAYYDQSVLFLYLNLATIASLRGAAIATAREEAISNIVAYPDEVAPLSEPEHSTRINNEEVNR